MDGGCTKKRRQIPPIEKPISCVDITSIHWSNTKDYYVFMNESHARTSEVVVLVVENTLDRNDIRSVGTTCPNRSHDCS